LDYETLIAALVGGVTGGLLSLAGVYLQAKMARRESITTEHRERLADAAVLWMTSVARIAHVNHEKQDEIRDATFALTDAKLRLVVLGNSAIWTALLQLEKFPAFHESDDGRKAFRQVVHAIRSSLTPDDSQLDSETIDRLLLGQNEATVTTKERHWL
jgi:hypothetical protein